MRSTHMTPPGARCPVCGGQGFRSIRWVGPQLIYTCGAGHPYLIPDAVECVWADFGRRMDQREPALYIQKFGRGWRETPVYESTPNGFESERYRKQWDGPRYTGRLSDQIAQAEEAVGRWRAAHGEIARLWVDMTEDGVKIDTHPPGTVFMDGGIQGSDGRPLYRGGIWIPRASLPQAERHGWAVMHDVAAASFDDLVPVSR